MELQALLVLCGVGVAGVAVVLLMGLFSASGTSYEEAIAQQRKATTELLALAESKNKPKKKEKKANKKLAKKEKREATVAAGAGSEAESEAPADSGADEEPQPAVKPHVDFSPPVVVDVPDTPPNVKIRKRGKDPKVKPILLNKEDPSCVSDPSAATPGSELISNHFEELHPKDEFELKHSTLAAEKVQEKKEEPKDVKPKQAKGGKAKQAEPAKEEAVRERHNSGDAPKEQRKAKKAEKKPVNEEGGDAPREEVVPPLNAPQPSELTTDKLLKQVATTATASTASPPGKSKKKKAEPNVLSLMAGEGAVGGVNVGELVRLVREAPLSRTEVQILTDALLNRHHDSLPQHSEWTEGPNDPMQKLKKQLADKEKALADEIEASQALHAKLKELRATLNAERTRAGVASRAAEAAAAAARAELHTQQARLQRLLEDNHSLAQDKILLQSKLGVEGEAQAQRVQMEMHIQRLSESEAALVSQLNALQAELQARVLEANHARDAMIIAQQHAADLVQQLQDTNHALNELEGRLHGATMAEQRAAAELRAAQEQLAALAERATQADERAKQADERAKQAEERAKQADARAAQAEADAQRAREDSEKNLQQLTSANQQLAAAEEELAELRPMRLLPAQNGLPPGSDQHKAAELAKVESVVESLRGELASAARSSLEQKDQLARMQDQLAQYQHKNNDQLAQYQHKNNELRTKNWKVMEALQSTEKALQSKASALPAQELRESHYSEVANILRTACPSAAPGSASAVGREWLEAFADNLKQELEKKEAEKIQLEKQVVEKQKQVAKPVEAAVPDARLKDLTAQNETLQALVDKYKTIIDDTEGVLSRLQHNVTTEEERWAQLLGEKQRELDELKHRTLQQMQKKIDALQEELEQAKGANHNHSFADAERLTEEKLMMAGLSSKQNTDVCNGPTQVLEEK